MISSPGTYPRLLQEVGDISVSIVREHNPKSTIKMSRLLTSISLEDLELAPSQTWGAVRLVPLIRRNFREDLRLTKRNYNSVVSVEIDRRTNYYSYVPHGLVLNWSDDGTPVVALGGKLSQGYSDFTGIQTLKRMAQREDKNALRFLSSDLAMEGFLGMFFNAPNIAWREYSNRARSDGLSPRAEYSICGYSIQDLSEALRVFEVYEQQVGVLLFVGEILATAFIVPHPADYRALHETLLMDAYGETFYYYGLYGQAQEFSVSIDDKSVHSLADLRMEIDRIRQDWGNFQSIMAADLLQRSIQSQQIYQAGIFSLQRFITDLNKDLTNYIGESIVDDRGHLQYLKIYGLSASQTRRAYLLQQLDRFQWHLETAAIAMKTTLPDLVYRIEKANLGYIINNEVRERSRKARK
jgi:hypothetical protein